MDSPNAWQIWGKFAKIGWWFVYLFFSGLDNEYTAWVITFCNTLQKDVNPPFFSVIIAQLLDESSLINKPKQILIQGNYQINQNTINFMIIQSNFSFFLILDDMSYEPNTYNQSILPNDSYYDMSDCLDRGTNNDLHLDKFMINCQAISHKSSLNAHRDINNIKNLNIENDSNKFVIGHISK